jgi:hypothetical protein
VLPIKAFFVINYALLLKLQCPLHCEHLSVHVALLEVQQWTDSSFVLGI